MMKLVIN